MPCPALSDAVIDALHHSLHTLLDMLKDSHVLHVRITGVHAVMIDVCLRSCTCPHSRNVGRSGGKLKLFRLDVMCALLQLLPLVKLYEQRLYLVYCRGLLLAMQLGA